jgi:hypothetical protein
MDEDQEIIVAGTNDLPAILSKYGPSNNLSHGSKRPWE